MPAAPEALTVRGADAPDLPAVAAIYAAGVAERRATFMTAAPQTDDLRGWLTDGLPFVITTDPTSGVVGWAKVFPYADRCAFEGIGEHAVYVDPEARGRGVGRALLEGLIDAAGRDGLRKLTARIFATNTASLALHDAAGFERVGVQRRHGKLDGRWHDLVLVERLLDEA